MGDFQAARSMFSGSVVVPSSSKGAMNFLCLPPSLINAWMHGFLFVCVTPGLAFKCVQSCGEMKHLTGAFLHAKACVSNNLVFRYMETKTVEMLNLGHNCSLASMFPCHRVCPFIFLWGNTALAVLLR